MRISDWSSDVCSSDLALDTTLQDIVIRYERLRGKDALWVVGTDHAGIATQMVVERQMNAKGQKRTDFTRDEFVARIWAWEEEREIGRASCRERGCQYGEVWEVAVE